MNVQLSFVELGVNGDVEPQALNLMSPTRLTAGTQLAPPSQVQLSANALQNVVQVRTKKKKKK